jgi:TLD
MASSKCSISGCKRDFDTLCTHCQSNVCLKHYIEHAKLANVELVPLADRLNSLINSIQQLDPLPQAFQQLEQWREISHQYIDKLCNEKKQEIKAEVQRKLEIQMNKLRELSQQVKELIDEGDASFKQIENIKRDIDECQKQLKQFEKADYIRLSLKPIQIDTFFMNQELFTGGGTLLSSEQQIKLNEFYGKEDQKWILIYKATRDGFGSSDFHRCCNNKGPTITVIQSKDGGYLFGAYTSVSWTSIENYVEDRNGPFLFTLTNPHAIPPTKYPVKIAQYSIFDKNSYGPTFGGGADLHVCNNSQMNGDSYFGFPHSYMDTTNLGTKTFTGNRKFQTSDIEVYRLMIN